MSEHTLKPLITKEEIEHTVRELALQISCDYRESRPVLIGVLKGAFVFLADLIRHLSIDTIIDFMQVSSYGSDTVSSGMCAVTKDIHVDIRDKDVLIVEDIVDTGATFHFLLEHVRARHPRSLKICALLDKTSRRTDGVTIDYCGFSIGNEFVVGYGLDCDERYRSLPGIYALKNK